MSMLLWAFYSDHTVDKIDRPVRGKAKVVEHHYTMQEVLERPSEYPRVSQGLKYMQMALGVCPSLIRLHRPAATTRANMAEPLKSCWKRVCVLFMQTSQKSLQIVKTCPHTKVLLSTVTWNWFLW